MEVIPLSPWLLGMQEYFGRRRYSGYSMNYGVDEEVTGQSGGHVAVVFLETRLIEFE